MVVVLREPILYNAKNNGATGNCAILFMVCPVFNVDIYNIRSYLAIFMVLADTTSELYNKGANWVGILFGVYNGFAALVAFLLPVLAEMEQTGE